MLDGVKSVTTYPALPLNLQKFSVFGTRNTFIYALCITGLPDTTLNKY